LMSVSMMYAWLPSYMNRVYGLEPARAAVQSASMILVGCLGAVAFGMLADAVHRRYVRGRLLSAAAAAALTGVSLIVAFGALTPGGPQIGLIILGCAAMAGTVGPVASAVADVAPVQARASALSILALAQNLVGLAVGPVLAGAFSDRLGLQTAMAVVPVASLFAAAVLVRAARAYAADVRRPGVTDMMEPGDARIA